MKRSHKAEFQRWRAELEAKHGMMIYDRLSDVIDTNDDLTVGDMVLFTNDYGVTFVPMKYWDSVSRIVFYARTVTPKTRIVALSF